MKIYSHTDKLGRELAENDVVVYSSYFGGLALARVAKLNRIRLKLRRLQDNWTDVREESISPLETVKIDSKDVEFYLLKQPVDQKR